MRKGEWEFNGDAIRINGSGKVVDGQHRLHAIIKADKAIQCLVVSGLKQSAFATIDCGKARSNGDALAIKGYRNANILAAALAMIYLDEQGELDSHWNLSPRHGQVSAKRTISLARKYPSVQMSATAAQGWYMEGSPLVPSAMAFLHYRFGQHSTDEADQFFQLVATGENLSRNHPILMLRKTLIRLRTMVGNKGAPLSRRVQVGLTIKAWRAWVAGTEIKTLKFAHNESIPDIDIS
jgi:hypothetical protein